MMALPTPSVGPDQTSDAQHFITVRFEMSWSKSGWTDSEPQGSSPAAF